MPTFERPPERLAGMIDHTLLRADATPAAVEALCAEARRWRFASVCVNGSYVELAARELAGSGVKVCTVVGFPLGAMSSAAKAAEARDAVGRGADEVDMVLNVGRLKAGDDGYVRDDVAAVREAAAGRTLKVILETCLLTDEEKERACRICREAGADFVKTSTGFGPAGAQLADIALFRAHLSPREEIKAAGGIRTRDAMEAFLRAGCERLGASAAVSILAPEIDGQA